MSKHFAILIALLVAYLTTSDAHAAGRVALLIGNSKYSEGNILSNPVNDVNLLGEAFKRAGFDIVIVLENLDREEMVDNLDSFSYIAKDADIAVVFYSGHGTEINGADYLIPTDFRQKSLLRINEAAVSLDQVLLSIKGAKTLKLVLLDACRVDTLKLFGLADSKAASHVGLVEIEPTEPNTLIAFAAKSGAFALDGSTQASPYAVSLARRLLEPGVDVQLMLRQVRDDVLTYTGGFQEPIAFGTLSGSVVPLSKELPEFVFGKSSQTAPSLQIDDGEVTREVLSVFSNDPLCQFHRYSDLSIIGKSVSQITASVLVKIRISNAGSQVTSRVENQRCGHGKYSLWPQQASYLVIRAGLRHYDTGWRLENWEPGWLAADNSWHSAL